jgi:SAM-dependent methyltransferase
VTAVEPVASFIAAQRRFWSLGDYRRVAVHLQPAAPALVAACGVGPGDRVLDVGAGDGNVAEAAARAGASVVASDLAPALVALGRERTAGTDVEWLEADAEALPLPDASFDAALSAFSLQYAPRPGIALAQAVRVTRPGGMLGLASWTPDGYTAAMSAIAGRHLPPPPLAVPSPWDWGDVEIAEQRLRPLADIEAMEHDAIQWEFGSLDDARHHLEANTPIVVLARELLDPAAYGELVDELLDLVRRRGVVAPDGAIAVAGDYLRVVARRR